MTAILAPNPADPLAAARARIISHYTGTETTTPVTVPDGYELERIGQCWTVGPAGSGTHLLVTELWQVPSAIAAFEQQLARAVQIGGGQ